MGHLLIVIFILGQIIISLLSWKVERRDAGLPLDKQDHLGLLIFFVATPLWILICLVWLILSLLGLLTGLTAWAISLLSSV